MARPKHEGLSAQLAETLATIIQALRLGQSSRAREVALTALAVYASTVDDIDVDELLHKADPYLGLGERAGVLDDPVLPEEAFEVLAPPDHAPRRLMRSIGLISHGL